jgi:neopullulanase
MLHSIVRSLVGLGTALILLAASGSKAAGPVSAPGPRQPDYLERPLSKDVVYFVVTDRMANGDPSNDTGGIAGGPMRHGFDPSSIGMFQGGDFKGLTEKLDYIQGLGATAIWVTPALVNKPVEHYPGGASAGYHGYWGVDFLNVDPHLGGNDAFKTFVDAAHARGIKVILDIVVNHTANIFDYKECQKGGAAPGCAYRSKGDYPVVRRARDGAAINGGFMGDNVQTEENFARLIAPDYAYQPFVPPGLKTIKNPAWLNDPRFYHHRGETTYRGESSLFGDFARLDDLYTENPFVQAGLIDIYKHWIKTYRIDGFRLDTAKHVEPQFWHRFTEEITAFARAEGIPRFIIFAEVADWNAADLASFLKASRLPSALDFAFLDAAIDVLARGKGMESWERLLRHDALYEGGGVDTSALPVFVSNHDHGRMAFFIRSHNRSMSAAAIQSRVALAHAMMFFVRGAPVIYYGDEQGFMGTDGDKAARQPMFASPAKPFMNEERLSAPARRGGDSFDVNHPLYRAIAAMAALRKAHPGLAEGPPHLLHYAEGKPGLLVLHRFDASAQVDYLIAFNAGEAAQTARFEVPAAEGPWLSLRGECAAQGKTSLSYAINAPGLDYVICQRRRTKP